MLFIIFEVSVMNKNILYILGLLILSQNVYADRCNHRGGGVPPGCPAKVVELPPKVETVKAPPEVLNAGGTDHPLTVLKHVDPPVIMKVPKPMPQEKEVTPPLLKVRIPHPVPHATPPFAQGTPPLLKVAVPHKVPHATPPLAPVTPPLLKAAVPHKVPHATPPLAQGTPPLLKAPPIVPHQAPHLVSSNAPIHIPAKSPNAIRSLHPSHHIVTTHSLSPIISGHYNQDATYTFEVVEPGIQNKEVKVFRSNDAEEMVYKDTIAMDKTGFSLTVIGIRSPNYNK